MIIPTQLKNHNAFRIELVKGASVETISSKLKTEHSCHFEYASRKWHCPISEKSKISQLLEEKNIKAKLVDCTDKYIEKSQTEKRAEDVLNKACYKEEELYQDNNKLLVEKDKLDKEVLKKGLSENDPSVNKKREELKKKENSLSERKNEIDQIRNHSRLLEEKAKQESSEWSEPIPIRGELFPVYPFDAEKLLPDELRPFVVDVAERMPAPLDFVAAPLIVALGGVIGAQVAIRPKSKDSWMVVPNLWGGVVGEPSSKKSPSIDAAMKPLEKLTANERDKFSGNELLYESERIVYEAKIKALEESIKVAVKNKKDPNTPAKELVEHKQQNAPISPVQRRFKTNDTTIEKLGELLRDNPSGMMVLRDELVGLLASWEKQGHEGDRSFFLESWNGSSSYDTDRIIRGSINIPNLCISLFGGIQPDKLTRYLDQASNSLANDGMLQRFQVMVYPDPRRWEWVDRIPNYNALENVCKIFKLLGSDQFDPLILGAHPKDTNFKIPYFHFDEESQEIFIDWSTIFHKRLETEDNPIIQQHLAKYDKLFPALALIFHMVECALGKERGSIKVSSVKKASYWCEYLESHARRCYGLLLDDGLRAAQALSEKLIEGKKITNGFTLRDIRRNQWRYLTTDVAIQSALDWLHDANWLKPHNSGGTGPGSGQPTIKYSINPKIFSLDHDKKDGFS